MKSLLLPLQTTAILWCLSAGLCLTATAGPQTADPDGQLFRLKARASEIDSRVQSHPEINFVLETSAGRPADNQYASVDTRVEPRGELVIWLMGYSPSLFERLNSYGLHAIQPHYARQWFGICCQERPVGPQCRGNMRLEAATGEDFSDEVQIPHPDGMMERSFQFVRWLHEQNPEGHWDQFISETGDGLRWDKVIMAGASHGSTTSARFAKHQKVARVVAFCGPRDQYQDWQALPSATPPNRFFGFTHVLDGGWTGNHYCRSWELLGMHRFGPIVDVDETDPPYGNTRRLITAFDVDGSAKRAHSSVTPGSSAKKTSGGALAHEDVWRYLFTHPVDQVGESTDRDPACHVEGAPVADSMQRNLSRLSKDEKRAVVEFAEYSFISAWSILGGPR